MAKTTLSTLQLTCPAGKRIVAGGGSNSNALVQITSSYPASDGSGWFLTVVNQTNQSQTTTLRIEGFCAFVQ